MHGPRCFVHGLHLWGHMGPWKSPGLLHRSIAARRAAEKKRCVGPGFLYIFTHNSQRSGYNCLLLHGSIVAAEKYCRWTLMNPLFLLREDADTLSWDHCCCRKIVPMVSNGSGISH